ncbi:mycofactocin oligosaccharide methyltransferase MftM [Gordonia rubripertincta]|uniref:Mycofactocin oligosaccharide methyltransferase MftM n=1 Tax=Gordonia rubripertincta TaxID=36822 RepID=A0ABT4N140_GORRU|nr:mycofactocin oligosaccharide methyltransferase MftM [Gordonia rubripertincta]MCZ4552979.1 mycofactocin oligosaccharide methyltransferase MftM [Gordonia rubripertincta]
MPTPTLLRRRHVSNSVVVEQSSIPSGYRRNSLLAWARDENGALDIRHALTTDTISDALMIDELVQLVNTGVLCGQEQFEAAAIGLILTCGDSPESCWQAFYRNSLAELESSRSPFAPIHRRALSLLQGSSVLEVGSCFGFFALRAAAAGFDVSACDISSGAVTLLGKAAGRMGLTVQTQVGNAVELPYPTDCTDTVTLIHLLEHLPDQVDVAINEALRVARRRVVIAVPFEEVPSPHFGHHQRLTSETLVTWAARADHRGARIFTDHGGWLVLQPPGA